MLFRSKEKQVSRKQHGNRGDRESEEHRRDGGEHRRLPRPVSSFLTVRPPHCIARSRCLVPCVRHRRPRGCLWASVPACGGHRASPRSGLWEPSEQHAQPPGTRAGHRPRRARGSHAVSPGASPRSSVPARSAGEKRPSDHGGQDAPATDSSGLTGRPQSSMPEHVGPPGTQ